MSNETGLPPKIQAALTQLDQANDDHWTSDGLPNTRVVQRIANDETIKRADIQAALPGFDRAAATAAPGSGTVVAPGSGTGGAPADSMADGGTKAETIVVEGAATETVEISDAQLHAMLAKRVHDGEQMIEQGRVMEKNGVVLQSNGRAALQAAQRDMHKYFPPMTAAQNIKAHLKAENEARAARVRQQQGASQLDMARRGGNSRGWNPSAQSRGAFSRKDAARVGGVVPGSPAALAQAAAQAAVRTGVKA